MSTPQPEDLTPATDEELLADPGAAGEPGPQDGRDGQSGAGSDSPELLNPQSEADEAVHLADQEDLTIDDTPLPEEL